MPAYKNYDDYKLANPFDKVDHLEAKDEQEQQEDEEN